MHTICPIGEHSTGKRGALITKTVMNDHEEQPETVSYTYTFPDRNNITTGELS